MVIIITESQLSKILTEQNNFIIKENVDNILTEQYNYQPKPIKSAVGPSCQSKWSPYLKQAKDYWIQWLSNPITKSKFKKNWNVGVDNKIDGITVDDLFKKYINALNLINLVYYDKTSKNYIQDVSIQGAYAYVIGNEPTKIYVNCSVNDNEPYETLIHEIQHTLYNIKPLNPSVKIGNVFVNDKTKKTTPSTFFSANSSQIDNVYVKPPIIKNQIDNVYVKPPIIKNQIVSNIESVAKTYNISEDSLYYWSYRAIREEKVDPGYTCSVTEKMSNIMAIRKYFNLKPGGNITKEMLIPYIKQDKKMADISWVLLCWALNGFPDINIMLNKINQLAYQDTKQNNNTRIA